MDLESPLTDTDAPQRRRGKALEEALLDAAWAELVEHGYANFTYDGVAKRAETSRPVLYRRWPTKPDLLKAAISHYVAKRPVVAHDTGSLRGDVIDLMQQMSKERAGAVALVLTGLGDYYEETGETFADIRDAIKSGRTDVMAAILERAVERGEADPARLTARIEHVAFDLVRNELMLSLKPVPLSVIEEIVDTIFLPLVRPAQA